MKDKSVHENASKLLKHAKVAPRIAELQKIAADVAEKHFRIDSKELLGHLNILRQSRIDEYVDFVEYEKTVFNELLDKEEVKVIRELQFKPFDQLTEHQLMCIESVKQNRYGEIELKLHGKDWTIEKIAKHIGFYEKDNEQKAPGDTRTPEERDARINELIEKYNANRS